MYVFLLVSFQCVTRTITHTHTGNMVFTMIPARNKEEYDLFPSEDSEFVKRWLTFTDDNVKYLRNTMPIPTLGSPSLSGVDGTAAMYEDEGYLFLFNPSYVDMPVRVVRKVRA